MAEEEKSSESQPLLFPEVDPAGMAADDPEQNSATKALVPFDPLQRYLAEIRRFSILSREEEHRLAVEYKEYGNIEAAYKLVTADLRLAAGTGSTHPKT